MLSDAQTHLLITSQAPASWDGLALYPSRSSDHRGRSHHLFVYGVHSCRNRGHSHDRSRGHAHRRHLYGCGGGYDRGRDVHARTLLLRQC